MAEGTPIDGQDLLIYKCDCGEEFIDKGKLGRHLLVASRKDGKGIHHSLGRVNKSTGEIIMPPFLQRTKEEKKSTIYGLKKENRNPSMTQTQIITDASQIKFVPRVLTATFTPIMLSGMTAAQRVWGWRQDMPFENFLDTVIIYFFRDHGIELASFVINDPKSQESAKEQNMRMQQETLSPEEQEQMEEKIEGAS